MILSKLSIGYLLLRFTFERLYIWIIYAAMVSSSLVGLAFIVVVIAQCQPVPYYWDKDLDGHCIPIDVVIILCYVYSGISVITDFTFALLPIPIIWNLNMNKRKKLAVIPILAIACL